MSKTEDARYKVVRDYQGGSWGESLGAQTAAEWLDTAADWLEADGHFDQDDAETVDEFKERWLDLIDQGREQELIDYIAEMWQIELVKV